MKLVRRKSAFSGGEQSISSRMNRLHRCRGSWIHRKRVEGVTADNVVVPVQLPGRGCYAVRPIIRNRYLSATDAAKQVTEPRLGAVSFLYDPLRLSLAPAGCRLTPRLREKIVSLYESFIRFLFRSTFASRSQPQASGTYGSVMSFGEH